MRKRIRLPQNKDNLHDLGSDDLLSRLSDDILVSILSYLPLKDAAVTSKLSRRWRYLWCQMVRLDFEDKERSNKIGKQIYYSTSTKKYNHLVLSERNKYINWVNRIIRQHKSPTIDEFKICFDLEMNAKGAIGKWIEFAISKNVQRLELDLDDGFKRKENYVFPGKIFDRKCGSSLKQPSINVHVRPYATVMEIKFLKALILKGVNVNDEGLEKILSICPVLEHLSIHESGELEKPKINGKGLALKSFEIIDCDGLESIEICDSNIVSFNCIDDEISLRFDNLQKLEKIAIHDNQMKSNDVFCRISCGRLYLQVLELQIYNLQLFPFPKLPTLEHLIMEVGAWEECRLYVLTYFVEGCPSLETFTTKLFGKSTRSGLINREVRQAAKQPHQDLVVVEIDVYCGHTIDLELAMYFMENSVALKKLVIKPYMEETGLTANEITEEKNRVRYIARQQLEPITPVDVELVIL